MIGETMERPSKRFLNLTLVGMLTTGCLTTMNSKPSTTPTDVEPQKLELTRKITQDQCDTRGNKLLCVYLQERMNCVFRRAESGYTYVQCERWDQ